MLHEHFAKAVSVGLLGSSAWNNPVEANATHLTEYRTLQAHLPQKLCGRRYFAKLPFSLTLV
jgi:hypothetical protein